MNLKKKILIDRVTCVSPWLPLENDLELSVLFFSEIGSDYVALAGLELHM